MQAGESPLSPLSQVIFSKQVKCSEKNYITSASVQVGEGGNTTQKRSIKLLLLKEIGNVFPALMQASWCLIPVAQPRRRERLAEQQTEDGKDTLDEIQMS